MPALPEGRNSVFYVREITYVKSLGRTTYAGPRVGDISPGTGISDAPAAIAAILRYAAKN